MIERSPTTRQIRKLMQSGGLRDEDIEAALDGTEALESQIGEKVVAALCERYGLDDYRARGMLLFGSGWEPITDTEVEWMIRRLEEGGAVSVRQFCRLIEHYTLTSGR